MHISSYPPVWTTRPANEPGRYDLASAIRIRTGAHSFEGKVFNASACKNKRVPKPLDDMGASSAAIVTGQVFDVSMPAGEVEEAKEVASESLDVEIERSHRRGGRW